MQIAILVEQMRREGYELMISRPEVIFHRTENDALLEPIENLYVDLPNENLGDILQSIANRKGEILAVHHHASRVSIEAIVPTRGLIGFETDFVNQTRGEGIMSHLFRESATVLAQPTPSRSASSVPAFIGHNFNEIRHGMDACLSDIFLKRQKKCL